MAWEKSRDKWLRGTIQDLEDKADVVAWLLHDPVWTKADKVSVFVDGKRHVCEKGAWTVGAGKQDGSHFALIYCLGMSSCGWRTDLLSVSDSKGRYVKRWIVKELANGYRQLSGLIVEGK